MKMNNVRDKILTDRNLRRTVTQKSHYWFFHIFLSHYVKHETAPFQKDMFKLSEDNLAKLVAIMAFRNSGKSTILNLSYVLWSILGVQQKKFVVLISKTREQAKTPLPKYQEWTWIQWIAQKRPWPIHCESDQWGMHSLQLPHFQAKITCVSKEQSIRGMRHLNHRQIWSSVWYRRLAFRPRRARTH